MPGITRLRDDRHQSILGLATPNIYANQKFLDHVRVETPEELTCHKATAHAILAPILHLSTLI